MTRRIKLILAWIAALIVVAAYMALILGPALLSKGH